MADPERTMLDRADVGPVVAPAAHSHDKTEIGAHADRHAANGTDPIAPESINAYPTVVGTLTNADNLDTLTTPGTYFLGNSSGITTANGFPLDGWAGWIEVQNRYSSTIQKAYSIYSGEGAGNTSGNVWVRTNVGSTWEPWLRLDPGAVTTASIIKDTGWRRLLSWHGGVQDSTGQVGTVDTSAYTLIGDGSLDLRRRDNYVMFRSEFAVSGGGAIRSLSATPRALFTDFVMPVQYRVNEGLQWGIMMPIGYRGEQRLLIGSPGDQQSFGFCTPDGPFDIRGIAGGYPCTYFFPGAESYIGTPA